MARRQRPKVAGITVYKRGSTWSYRLDLGGDPVTDERQRENKGGFDSEDAAWKAALESQSRLAQGRHVKPSQRKVAEFLDEWLTVVKDQLSQARIKITSITSRRMSSPRSENGTSRTSPCRCSTCCTGDC